MRTSKPTHFLLAATLAISAAADSATGAGIPDRPEKLTFPSFAFSPPSAATYRTPLASGPIAYIAEDRELPLVSLSITLRGGQYLEPAGKEGLADLTGYLLSRSGTKSFTAEELEERLAFLAANLGSSTGEDRGGVSLNLLSKDLDEGLKILREVLTEPRFQESRLTLRKEQLITDMKARNDDSQDIEARERSFLVKGEAFYTNHYPTKVSLDSIRREDVVAFHRQWFDPRNMIIAASGDFSKAEMVQKLDALFASWPFQGKTAPAVPKPDYKMPAGLFIVDKDVNQGRVSVLLPGVLRTDPDSFAIQLMNDVLGGGGFTSRITNRVRSDEGLAYSAGSRISGGVWYPGVVVAGFQSKVRTCSYATQIVLEEMGKIRSAEVTDEELLTAKRSSIETLPRRFATKSQTMGLFVDEEFTDRFKSDPNYYANFRANVEKVTKADVKRAAERLLATDSATVLVVGKRSDLLNPDPKHPIHYPSLAGGKLTDIPLRDPMTMKPLAAPPPAK